MKTLMAMSGGVDSSVAAWLLAEAGHELIGVSMQLWDARAHGGSESRCCSPADFRDARLVASRAGFPYYILDYEAPFQTHVVEQFAREYRAGRTPNPCVECNRRLKFGALLDTAERLGAARVATGHYARLDTDPASGGPRLRRARDLSKDQSYFLCMLPARALDRAVFPIGELVKEEVRGVARRVGLGVAEKPESQDLCFLGSQDRLTFLARQDGGGADRPGEMVSSGGRHLGTHAGLAQFTVGQRRGLGSLPGGPWYVLRLEPAANRVVVGRETEQYSSGLRAAGVSWIGGALLRRREALVRIRHSHQPAEATLFPSGTDRVHVRFRCPQRAVTPGQTTAFYDGDTVLGGGRIEAAEDALALTGPDRSS